MTLATAPAPGGTFVLRRANPAVCPPCGRRVSALWTYISDDNPTIYRPVSCESCAGTTTPEEGTQ